MQTLYNGTYTYKGYWGCDSQCHLEVLQGQFRTLVIATEIAENEGTSVTNCAEQLATEIAKQYHLNPLSLTWIEHYGPMSYHGGRDKDRYRHVTFQWENGKARRPEWWPISEEQLTILRHENVPNAETL